MNKFLIILFISTLCLGGCGNTQPTAQGADSIDIHIAVMPTAVCQPLNNTFYSGVFEAQGIKVRLHHFNSLIDIDTAVTKGHVNVFVTDGEHFASLKSENDNILTFKTIADEYLLVTNDSNIRHISHLHGRTIGVTRNSNIGKLFDALCLKAHFKQGDCYPIQINNVCLRQTMLEESLIDAAFLPHPQADTAIARGAHIIDFNATSQPFIIAMRQTEKTNSHKLELFKQAYEAASSSIVPQN